MRIRMTDPTLRVLGALAEAHPQPLAGSDFINTIRIFSGTLYPILERLERAGWIEGKWEDVNPSEAKRPRRKYYTFTCQGRVKAANALQERNRNANPGKGVLLPEWLAKKGMNHG